MTLTGFSLRPDLHVCMRTDVRVLLIILCRQCFIVHGNNSWNLHFMCIIIMHD